jgi:hypothetical protein
MNKVFIVIIAGMILFSCDNGTLPDEEKAVNPLIGTWVFENENILARYEFADTTFSYYYKYKPNDTSGTYTGQYVYDEYHVIFLYEIKPGSLRENSLEEVLYRIVDGNLNIDAQNTGFRYFIKQ